MHKNLLPQLTDMQRDRRIVWTKSFSPYYMPVYLHIGTCKASSIMDYDIIMLLSGNQEEAG